MKTKVDIDTKEERDFSHILSGSEKFERLGITFKLAKLEDEERVWKFFVEEFIPDEPLSRSLGMVEPRTFITRTVKKETRKDILKKCFSSSNSYSIIAVDSNNEILGIKLGYLTNTKMKHGGSMHYPWLKHFYWALPETIVNFNIVGWHMEVDLGYHPKAVMKDLEVDCIFEGMVLGVSRKARGMGLGKEMAQMSIAVARELGCEAYFVCVSGMYSQKIYRDLNFTVMKEVTYEDIKDRKGRTILNDTREHTKAQNVYMRL